MSFAEQEKEDGLAGTVDHQEMPSTTKSSQASKASKGKAKANKASKTSKHSKREASKNRA
ncbi:hypothetical protein [Arachidicoccus sp.]|uniref:hypothetical protein n=1 Tax=Arachidicoccus sp. TaxID=1872624 RepID=UPI003D254030